PSRGFAHRRELTSFVVDGKIVSNNRRGKAALSAERQAFQRHKAARLRDATDEVFRRLHLRPLGADQPEDHHLVIRDMPERCKRARPIVVVFEEKPRCTDALENRPGNRLLVALDEPTAFLVATTEVDSEGHVGKSRHDGVVDLNAPAQPLIERPALRFIKGPGLRREEQGIVRRVDLNIGGTEANELRNLITEDRDHVGEEVLKACIRGLGTFRRPEIHEQAGARRTNSSAARYRLRTSLLTTPRLGGRSRRRSPTAPSPCQWPHKNALMSQAPQPSTASVIWLWNESRRISPSVTMSSPAASWRKTASSTARSSVDLNCA